MTYGGAEYPFVLVANDILQVGGKLTDGILYAGEGKVKLGVEGILVEQESSGEETIKFISETTGAEVGYIDSELIGGDENVLYIQSMYSSGIAYSAVNIAQTDSDSKNSSLDMRAGIASLYGTDKIKLNCSHIELHAAAGNDLELLFWGQSNTGTITWMEDEAHFKLSSALLIGGDTAGEANTIALTNITSGVSTGAGSVLMNGVTARNSTGWLKLMDGTTAKYIPFWATITG
jgi:hypothetical protein